MFGLGSKNETSQLSRKTTKQATLLFGISSSKMISYIRKSKSVVSICLRTPLLAISRANSRHGSRDGSGWPEIRVVRCHFSYFFFIC